MRTLKHTVKSPRAALAFVAVALICAVFRANPVYAERGDEDRTQRVRSTDKKVESVEVAQPDASKSLVVRSQVSVPDYVLPPRTIADVIDHFRPSRAFDAPPTNCAIKYWAGSSTCTWRNCVLYYQERAQHFFRRGDVKSSLTAIQRLLNDISGRAPHMIARRSQYWVVAQALLARYSALTGDFKTADTALKEASRQQCLEGTWVDRIPCTSGPDGDWVKKHQEVARATVAQSKGFYHVAESYWREAMHAASEPTRTSGARLGPSLAGLRWGLQSSLADNLLRQGRVVEAEIEAREAVLLGDASLSESAFSLLTLAEVVNEEGRHSEARKLAKMAGSLYVQDCVAEESLALAWASRAAARTLVAQSQWTEVFEAYQSIQKAMAKKAPELFHRTFAADEEWALALIKTGRAEEAIGILQLALTRHRERLGEEHPLTAKALGILGMAQAALGRYSEALSAFRVAIPTLVAATRQGARQGSFSTTRSRQLRLILEAYIELLDDLGNRSVPLLEGTNPVAEMFRMAEIARSGSVQEAIAANSARAAAGTTELATLVRRLQDARNQVHALETVLLTAMSQPTDEQNPEVIRELQARIARLRGAGEQLSGEVEKRFPKYAALINPKPPTIEQVRGQLRVGESLIAMLVGDEQTYVWAVPKSGPVAYSSRSLGRQAIERLVGELRASLEPDVEMLSDIPTFKVEIAHRLYKELLEPVQSGWGQAKTLLVIADGALGQLPFTVLPTEPVQPKRDQTLLFSEYREVPWLARDYAIVNLPSVASLASLRSVQPKRAGAKTFAGFGDPWFSAEQAAAARLALPTQLASLDTRGLPLMRRFSPRTRDVDSAELARLPRLPETADEVRDMATALGADPVSSVFLGERATEAQVKAMNLDNRRVVAFATHGLVAGDLNGLTQPALALSSPKVTGGKEDGLLTMGEVLGLKLNADWVVLSACNTASADGAGAEAVSGLGRAFFYAGARSLLVTHWPVETTSAKALTTEVFKLQSANLALSRAQALRQAMLNLIDGPGYVDPASGQSLFSYAHPLFWAPFALVGDGAN